MSVSWGTQYAKLKTNLRLAANRLKLLQKKKTEQAMKARIEITEFLNTDKEDRARIRVESIIREDFIVEAYEILEMFCELLLARFGLIQQMKELDDGIAEAVSSLLWVAPRISHEVTEFKIINDELQKKYGKQFAEAARMNQLPEPSRVSPKLVQKLSVHAPSKILVEKYLIEIARCANISFTPDPKVMRDDDDEIAAAERNLTNFINEEQIGWSLPPPGSGGPGSHFGGGESGGMTASDFYPPPQYPNTLPPTINNSMYPTPLPNRNSMPPTEHPPAPPTYTDTQIGPNEVKIAKNPTGVPYVPSGIDADGEEHIYETPPKNEKNYDDFLAKFPEPPTDLPTIKTNDNNKKPPINPSNPNDDLDFDELAKRFQQLKKKF